MKRILAFTMALVLLVSVAASASPKVNFKRSTTSAGRYGGTLITALAGAPSTLNPFVASDPASGELIAPVFDKLTEVNPVTLTDEGALAEDWSVSRDGLTWTFELRRGLCWSDGTALTAEDVVFSMNLWTASTLWKNRVADPTLEIKVERADPRTVRMYLSHPFASLLSALPVIVPKARFEEALRQGHPEELWKAGTDLAGIAGTGPFIPVSFERTQVVYRRNPYHWRADRTGKPLPYVDRLVVNLVTDATAALSAFRSGETDWAAVSGQDWSELRRGERSGRYVSLDAGAGSGSTFLVFNQNPVSSVHDQRPELLAWFKNPLFRRAVAHSIDQGTIVARVYSGQATERWSVLPPALREFYNNRVTRHLCNLRQAESILEDEGFSIGRDKILRDAQGRTVAFSLAVSRIDPVAQGIAAEIAGQLARLGIQINISPVSPADLNPETGAASWEAAVLTLDGSPDPGELRRWWHSSGPAGSWRPGQGLPATTWEADVDQLLDDAARTTDRRERAKRYMELQMLLSEEIPVIPLPVPDRLYVVRKRIQDARIPQFGSVLGAIYGFWIGYTP